MQIKMQKRLAASILKCSEKRIWLDSNRLDEIKESITKIDIKNLIAKKIIKRKPLIGISNFRIKKKKLQKRKGKQKGLGSRKGKKTARLSKKDRWMSRIRIQRKFLRHLKDKGSLDKAPYQNLYLKSKGGFFRSKRHIKFYIEEHGLTKK